MKTTDALITERLLSFLVCSAVLLAFLIARIEYVFIERLWPDEALYAWYADQITQDPGFLFSEKLPYPPLFPLLLTVGKLFLPGEAGYRFLMLAVGAGGLLAAYGLGVRAGGYFLGAFCSFALAFTYPYFLTSTLMIVDTPLCILFMLLAWALLNVNERRHGREDWMVSGICAAIVLMKWSGILFLPLAGVYYLTAFPKIAMKERTRRLLCTLALPSAVMVLLILKNLWLTGKGLPSTTALKGIYFTYPTMHYFRIFWQLVAPFLIPFFLIGLTAVWKYERKVKVLLLAWGLIFFPVYCLIPEKDPRYVLPVIPCFIVLAGIGAEAFLQWLSKNKPGWKIGLQMALWGYLAFFTYYHFTGLLDRNVRRTTFAYTGLKEAGDWLNSRVTDDDLIFAASIRAMRYYTRMDFNASGGQLYPFPKEKEEFERMIGTAKGSVYLETDSWEYTQPEWIRPMNEEKEAYLKSLGFSVAHIVVRPAIYKDRRVRPAQVVWILYRK